MAKETPNFLYPVLVGVGVKAIAGPFLCAIRQQEKLKQGGMKTFGPSLGAEIATNALAVFVGVCVARFLNE